MPNKRVLLWTAPRCLSTAFERSIRNLPKSKVFHEPFSGPYISELESRKGANREQQIDAQVTYETVCRQLQADYSGVDLVFSKDIAICVNEKFDLFLQEGFEDFQHSFLIRDPRKSVPSLYRLFKTPGLTGREHASPVYAGFKELHELFQFVRQHLDTSPVVVDADDLLENPEGIMRAYCAKVGLKYQENMTRWSPGPVAGFECQWSDWHKNLLVSTGITRAEHKAQEVPEDLPEEVKHIVTECIPYYEAAHESRIRAAEGAGCTLTSPRGLGRG